MFCILIILSFVLLIFSSLGYTALVLFTDHAYPVTQGLLGFITLVIGVSYVVGMLAESAQRAFPEVPWL